MLPRLSTALIFAALLYITGTFAAPNLGVVSIASQNTLSCWAHDVKYRGLRLVMNQTLAKTSRIDEWHVVVLSSLFRYHDVQHPCALIYSWLVIPTCWFTLLEPSLCSPRPPTVVAFWPLCCDPIGFTPVKQFIINKFDKCASSALNSIVTQSTVLANLVVRVLWDLNIDYVGSLMIQYISSINVDEFVDCTGMQSHRRLILVLL